MLIRHSLLKSEQPVLLVKLLVETMAHSFAIDEHLEFQQDEAGTKAMFARERRSRERYNCCVAEDATMPVGSFFNEES